MNAGKVRVYRRIAAVILIICMLLGNTVTAAAEEVSAAVVRLTKTEGEVDVSSQRGKAVAVIEDMKLYNGYQVATQEASYAWITLDKTYKTGCFQPDGAAPEREKAGTSLKFREPLF